MKGYSEDFRFEDGIVFVRLSGEFPNALLRKGGNLFQPLVDACAKYECDKALIEATNLKADLGTLGLFRAGEDAAALSRIQLRVAIVTRQDMVDQFFEDVAANRGGAIRVFTDMGAASEWLQCPVSGGRNV